MEISRVTNRETRWSDGPAYHPPKRIVTKPTLLVEIVFLAPAEGGRQVPPVLGLAPHYRPHLVVQDRSARYGRLRGNVSEEDYLGVSFVEGPQKIDFGESVECVLRLDYSPDANYDALRGGATFTVREGAQVVAHGVVLERRSIG